MPATTKKSRVERLRNTNTAYLAIADEIASWDVLSKLAEESGNASIIQKMKNAKARYEADFKELGKKRTYHLSKLIEESPVMFNRILSDVLSQESDTAKEAKEVVEATKEVVS